MAKTEFPGGEHLTGKISGAFAAVKFIAEDGMAEVMEVHPDLVGAAAVQNAFDQADLAVGTEHPVFCFRRTALTPRYRHPLPVHWMTRNRLVDNTAMRPRQPGDQGQINFAHGSGRELF